MQKYICIHGHFYQPPRENPWLEAVELQDSALPYHDWNERITAECYAPNSAARMLDGEGRITKIANNFSRISFNIGPTVLAWFREKAPEVHEGIVAADVASRERFGGHGSALAQNYNHMIMPLANERDKETQIVWGIRDFEFRFGRKPEGMWLAETAADIATFEVMAKHGVIFTILSPFQASKVREIGKGNWQDVNGGRIDPTIPYLVQLPSGAKINVFFYDAPVSQAVAFERLLDSGEKFANRLRGAFADKGGQDQLVHIATDGESYGHHHKHGEMALAYALQHIEQNKIAILTNYGQYLASHPPTHEAVIHEQSAWSCSHGVGRWMTDCGCNSGRPGWRQHWRAPLRQALDWLRDELAPLYEQQIGQFVKDPWAARDDYISVILDRTPENIAAYFARHRTNELTAEDEITCLKLLELQRHAMLMYTSCGWFFDELSGLETVQVIQYAARAIQIAEELCGCDVEAKFLERLKQAKSNIREFQDGAWIYQNFVKPAMIDWQKIVAHYSISSAFQEYPETIRVFNYTFQDTARFVSSSGRAKLVVGATRVMFEITKESRMMTYAALYMGEHHVTGGVRDFRSDEAMKALAEELKATFDRGDFPETIRLMDRHLGPTAYSLKSLFRDEQRRVLNEVLGSAREDLEGRYRRIMERYLPLMRFLEDVRAPYPPALETAVDFIWHIDLCKELRSEDPAYTNLRNLIKDAQSRPHLFDAEFQFSAERVVERSIRQFSEELDNVQILERMTTLTELLRPLPVDLNLTNVQNVFYGLLVKVAPEFRTKAQKGSEHAQIWMDRFRQLGETLGFAPSLIP